MILVLVCFLKEWLLDKWWAQERGAWVFCAVSGQAYFSLPQIGRQWQTKEQFCHALAWWTSTFNWGYLQEEHAPPKKSLSSPSCFYVFVEKGGSCTFSDACAFLPVGKHLVQPHWFQYGSGWRTEFLNIPSVLYVVVFSCDPLST